MSDNFEEAKKAYNETIEALNKRINNEEQFLKEINDAITELNKGNNEKALVFLNEMVNDGKEVIAEDRRKLNTVNTVWELAQEFYSSEKVDGKA